MQVHAVEGITIQEDEPEESVSPVVTDDEGEDSQDSHEGEEEDSDQERSESGAEAEASGQHFLAAAAANRAQPVSSRQKELQVHNVSCTG